MIGFAFPVVVEPNRCPWSQMTAAGSRAVRHHNELQRGTLALAPSLSEAPAADVEAIRLVGDTHRAVLEEIAEMAPEPPPKGGGGG